MMAKDAAMDYAETNNGELIITDEAVIRWFESLSHEKQDEWVQDVTNLGTAIVQGHSVRYDDRGSRMDIEYTYLTRA